MMLDSVCFLLQRLFALAQIHISLPRLMRAEREAEYTRGDSVSWSRFTRGDLLEVPRTLFTHFGIYLGNGRVAHLIPDALPLVTSDAQRVQCMVTNARLLLGVLSKTASVRVDSVEEFAYGACIHLNRGDAQCAPLRAEECAARAETLLGRVRYSLLWNNCEHYVTHCRYGHARSAQTEQFLLWLKSVVRDPRTGLASVLVSVWVLVQSGFSLWVLVPSVLVPFSVWMLS